MLARGDVVGVFQVESQGMRRALVDMRPDRFEDIIALVALYRPGPMANIPTYCARKHGDEEPEYLHPMLEPILKETFGVIIYQEQVMQIAQVMAGYSLGEADLLRRAMGKKIRKEMEQQRERFVSGAIARGIQRGQADTIEKKITIAKRAYDILLNEVGFPPEDIIFDPNIFAVATGMEEHNGYGVDFIEAARWIRANLPHAHVSGGVSNFSFSFRGNEAVREAMHSVFLYHAIAAGMDMGIVNAGQMAVYDDLDAELRDACEDVALNRRDLRRATAWLEAVKRAYHVTPFITFQHADNGSRATRIVAGSASVSVAVIPSETLSPAPGNENFAR